MNGILNVLKPPGMTSHDAVAFVRKQFRTKKVGHTGTLDPEAAGVLPICIGKATKAVQYLTEKKKRYRANVKFGSETTTDDKYGEATLVDTLESIDKARLETVIKSFIGKQDQIPPIYSAIKVDGKKLYQYALQGQEVALEPRPMEIYSIDIIDYVAPDEVMIDVYCSKGTYIRSLCRDIGRRMDSRAHMSQLVRLHAEPFDIEQAVTLEEIEAAAKAGSLEEILLPVETAFIKYPAINIKESAKNAAMSGNSIYGQGIIENLADAANTAGEEFVSIRCEDQFLGLGIIKYCEEEQRHYLKIKKILVETGNGGQE